MSHLANVLDTAPTQTVSRLAGRVATQTADGLARWAPGGSAMQSGIRNWTRGSQLAGPRIKPVVFIVHGDPSIRASIETLIHCDEWDVQAFADARTFLRSHSEACGPACVVADINLSDLGGFELLDLVKQHSDLPVIFTANHATVRTTVRAMKAGALELLTTPLDESLMLDAIREGLQQSRATQAQMAESRMLHDRFASLSRRERQVMHLVVGGLPNKHVAEELGITVITVKTHRGQVMRKMRAGSLPHLVNMAASLNGGRAALPTGVSAETRQS